MQLGLPATPAATGSGDLQPWLETALFTATAWSISGRSRFLAQIDTRSSRHSTKSSGMGTSRPRFTLFPVTRRFHLTAAGLRRLAQDEGMTLDDLLRSRPVSSRWRRVLLERLDALAVVYRLASSIANLSHPIRFRWYRAMPMDAALALPDGRTLAIVRQGRTADRTGFAKRLWRLGEGQGGVLLLLSDEVRLRHARRLLARSGGADHRLSPQQGAEVFTGGLRVIEEAARSAGGVEIINVCLRKPDSRGYEGVSLDRLLNRINTSVAAADRHAFLIFDEGREEMVARRYRRLRTRNPVPSRFEVWEDGERTKNIPIENVIGGPTFRSSHSDWLLQMADLIAHALLEQEEEPSPRVERLGIDRAFGILDRALNRRASRRDPQGVVRG